MSLPKWREATVHVVAQKTGPAADLIVDDTLAALDMEKEEMTASHYLQFVRLLYDKLPTTLDRRQVCQQAQLAVLKAYGFKSS